MPQLGACGSLWCTPKSWDLFHWLHHRNALIDDVNREKFECLVAGHFECAVRYTAYVYRCLASLKHDRLPIRRFRRRAVDDVICFLARMGVKHPGCSGRYFNDSDDDLHIS